MQIRALTGFSENTIRQYGRSYTPLNGYGSNCTALGSPGRADRKQARQDKKLLKSLKAGDKVEVIDPATGKKKWVTVENAEMLANLINKGFTFIRNLRGGSGNNEQLNTLPPPASAGISKELLIGAAALALIFIFMNKK
jgi:hypothetical protein